MTGKDDLIYPHARYCMNFGISILLIGAGDVAFQHQEIHNNQLRG